MAAAQNDPPVTDETALSLLADCNELPPHPRATEIIQEAEFYLADDNLCQDPHLLALFEEGDGAINLSEICSFPTLRKFKPLSAVAQVLRQSTQIEVSTDGTRLRRKFPMQKSIAVQPKINPNRRKHLILQQKPWLTKGMLKPTGFEDYATDGPIKPSDYEEDRRDYDPENSFTHRIETAIMRFCARRKMHQETRSIFEKYMLFGGMDSNQRQFTGGMDRKEMENMTKREIAELTSYYAVSECVLDGLYEHDDGGPVSWYVDFEKTAKAFLSCHFVTRCDWYDENKVSTAASVLRNFYNYLLLHDVCPEYRGNLMAARQICDVAVQELPKLKHLDMRLPGGFNMACSTLFQGSYAGLHASEGDWTETDESIGWSRKDAQLVFNTALFAHGSDQQIQRYENGVESGTPCKVTASEDLGLEITHIEYPDETAKSIYDSGTFKATIVRPMGKVRCKRWRVPYAPPRDIPKAAKAAQEEFEFLIDEETLQFCILGMKIECCVKTLDLGFQWIDRVDAVYATFFTWLANERIREWTAPGPPKGWMARQERQKSGLDGEYQEDEGEGDDMDGAEELPY